MARRAERRAAEMRQIPQSGSGSATSQQDLQPGGHLEPRRDHGVGTQLEGRSVLVPQPGSQAGLRGDRQVLAELHAEPHVHRAARLGGEDTLALDGLAAALPDQEVEAASNGQCSAAREVRDSLQSEDNGNCNGQPLVLGTQATEQETATRTEPQGTREPNPSTELGRAPGALLGCGDTAAQAESLTRRLESTSIPRSL